MPPDPAVFLDRDGVLSRNVYYSDSGEYEAPRSASDLDMYPWVIPSLKRLNQAGYKLFLVSNQPSFAKGKTSLDELREVASLVDETLRSAGVSLSASYYCFHHPNSIVPDYKNCDCRKPSPKFLIEAERDFGLVLPDSWIIGDRTTDIECGQRAGVRTILVAPDHFEARISLPDPAPDRCAANLAEAVEIILELK